MKEEGSGIISIGFNIFFYVHAFCLGYLNINEFWCLNVLTVGCSFDTSLISNLFCALCLWDFMGNIDVHILIPF